MSSSQSNPIWYVYGIVPAAAAGDGPAAAMPGGIDGADVTLEQCDGLAALVSVLDGVQYAPDVIEANSCDVDWLSPRAVSHDLVLTWASDRGNGAVVPLPMFSLFSGRDAVDGMLRDRSAQLASALASVAQGREYALRVYRVDAELLAAITSLSPRLDALANQAAAASPGQRYLLERKLETEKRTELRAVSQRIVDEIVTGLAAHALRNARSPIPRISEGDAAAGTLVLNAAFLIAPAALEEFQRTLTTLVERHAAHGFRFDFTGPWPPYHFVTEAARDE
jgi:hypothetical protein